MPLVTLSGTEAFANIKANRTSLWPDGRRDQSRLEGVATVQFKPTFELCPGEAIFTMGSCFARNIEKRFSELGFDLPTMEITLPADERASDTPNDLLNKYPPHSILNELRWALDPESAFPEAAYLNLKKDLWHDPHLAGNIAPAPFERVRERRRMVEDIYRQLPRCRLVVMTLGLIEAWFDKLTGLYLNGAPPPSAFKADPDRFSLNVLTVDEVLTVLEQIRDLLVRFGHPDVRMMLTVSPVPFKVTFTGRDAIIANTYSKSALRAAAEIFVYRHDNVDYLPSYEIITHTARESAYIQDNRHITPSAVNEIVDRVVSAYCPNLSGPSHVDEEGRRSASILREALQKGDLATASSIFAKISKGHRYLRWGYTEAEYRLSYGKTLAKLESLADAQAHLSKAVALEPQNSDAQFNLGLVLAKLQRSLEAEDHLGLAVSLHPKSPEYRLRYARQLFANGKAEAAATELQIASEQHPRHQRITDFHLAVMASLKEKAANAKAAYDSVADEALAEPQNETALQGRAKVDN